MERHTSPTRQRGDRRNDACAICAHARRAALLLVLLGIATACQQAPQPPKTYPVKGKVVFLEGGSPAEGTIEFRSETEPLTALAEVQADGTFKLNTLWTTSKLDGAVEGEHTVTFISGVGKDQGQSTLRPSIAKEKYKVQPGDNDIVVKVAKPTPPG
jgi:hypothetical protein